MPLPHSITHNASGSHSEAIEFFILLLMGNRMRAWARARTKQLEFRQFEENFPLDEAMFSMSLLL